MHPTGPRHDETSPAGPSEGAGRSRARRVAVVGGDGIGPEVVAEALKVVAAAGVALETTEYDLGAGRYRRTGEVLPDSVLDELRDHDAILLGAIGPAVGDTSVPSGVLERGLLLRLRFELDLYVNLRPFRAVPGSVAAVAAGRAGREGEGGAGATVDFVVVRENTEGAYVGEGGFLRKGTADEVATQGSVNTRTGVERLVRFGFGLAERRVARQVTLVHKTNVLNYSGDLWKRAFDAVAAGHADVTTAYQHVDAACIHMVEHPEGYDVVVTDNLFGDILTDLAGAVCGGIGYAASANLHPGAVSMFEPVHGAAHDIAGTGRANPVAAVASAALMLEHLGEAEAAERIQKAVQAFVEDAAPSGAGGTPGSQIPLSRTTVAIGDAIAERL